MIIVGLLLVAAGTSTSTPIEPYDCRGEVPQFEDSAELARIVVPKVNFRDDVKGCPESESCIRKGYVVAGDTVVVSKTNAEWVCATFVGDKATSRGYLPANSVRIVPTKSPPKGDWVGVWGYFGNTIQIRETDGGRLHVVGHAIYPVYGPEGEYRWDNEGDFEADLSPDADKLVLTTDEKYGCEVQMQLIAGNLFVSDNSFCGGMNVRFDGVYRKAPDRKRRNR